jgi:hypothetical protein
MPIAVILSVGMDLSLSRSQSQAWQSAGYCVTSAGSIRDAIDRIRYGDFDLVLMGDSLPLGDRERLTFLIRALGSRVPVVCVSQTFSVIVPLSQTQPSTTSQPDCCNCVGEVLAAQVRKHAANTAMPSGRLLTA